MKPVSAASHAICFFVDALLIVVLGLLIDATLATNIAKKTEAYRTAETTYSLDAEEYALLQDSYGVYSYDENSSRVANSSLDEASKSAFLSDSRVKELRAELYACSKTEWSIRLIALGCSLGAASIVYCLVLPFAFHGKYTPGKAIFKIVVSDASGEPVRYFHLLPYQIVHLLLTLCSAGLLDVASLILVACSKNKRTLANLITGTYSVIDPNYVDEEDTTPEKLIEEGEEEERKIAAKQSEKADE